MPRSGDGNVIFVVNKSWDLCKHDTVDCKPFTHTEKQEVRVCLQAILRLYVGGGSIIHTSENTEVKRHAALVVLRSAGVCGRRMLGTETSSVQ